MYFLRLLSRSCFFPSSDIFRYLEAFASFYVRSMALKVMLTVIIIMWFQFIYNLVRRFIHDEIKCWWVLCDLQVWSYCLGRSGIMALLVMVGAAHIMTIRVFTQSALPTLYAGERVGVLSPEPDFKVRSYYQCHDCLLPWMHIFVKWLIKNLDGDTCNAGNTIH